ncbi:MAG: TlpA disulfide reductase family protein [Candidatus Omnitrophota bacterium]
MKKALVSLSIILTIGYLLLGLVTGNLSASAEEVFLNKKAPEFILEDINSEKLNLKDLCGKPILLEFWATWCPICRAAIPEVNKLYADYKEEGLIILGINIMGNKTKVDPFSKKEGIKYRVLLDSNGEVAEMYGVLGVPTRVLIDKDCSIRYIGNSMPERTLIEKLL